MKKKRKSLRVASAALVCAMTATSVLPAAAAKKNEETTQQCLQSRQSVLKIRMHMQFTRFRRR